MFPSRFYPDRMFAPRYFPKVGAAAPTPADTGYISDAYYYDEAPATGSVSGGAVQEPDVTYD
jgi:hypothetical protein